jgi:hypothetical protein
MIVVIGICRVSGQDHRLLGALLHPFHPSKDAVPVVELGVALSMQGAVLEATRS